jgi:hypothetical protein
MRIFRSTSPDEYAIIKDSKLKKEHEEFIRSAYHGGRTEIFKNRLEDGKGHHYDVNSLYPHVMEINKYPIGESRSLHSELSPERKLAFFNNVRKHRNVMPSYFIHAKVYVPPQHVPPLPYRDKGRLIFPTGTFTGYFCMPEFDYALDYCGVQVLEVIGMVVFYKEGHLFNNFIQQQKQIKLNSAGAKRTFSKLIQNSLYGKFGMARKRETYELHTPEREEALRNKGTPIAITNTYNNRQLITYLKLAFADYIRPQYAAFITSYARLELLKKLRDVPAEHLYYCDTDSIVSGVPFKAEEVHNKEYGKWKLERDLSDAIFILPKLYAEIDALTGEEELKSKGIVKDFQKTVSYHDYLNYYDSMVQGRNHVLYGELHHIKYYQRRKLMTSIKRTSSPDERIMLQKQFLFACIQQKRVYNFSDNSSIPIDLSENSS